MKGRDAKSSNFFDDDDSKQSLEDGLDHVCLLYPLSILPVAITLWGIFQGFTEAQLVQLEEARHSTDEREREIAQIAESINDLATIFRELSVLVVEQVSIRWPTVMKGWTFAQL